MVPSSSPKSPPKVKIATTTTPNTTAVIKRRVNSWRASFLRSASLLAARISFWRWRRSDIGARL